ncbi:type VI secretion system lipoprotein TssJ [Pseudoxanthomonas putridarboris]|uniref:Type VI secretion system lipoprotein TssJ n=1 Tax=Pseudoxanthomonas putridarboris TaxID=752605 RepID=A0ABU9J6J3_9GAMM
MKKTLKVLKDPSIPVGELKDQPSQVALSINASAGVNPNLYVPAEELPSTDEDTPYRVNLSSDDLGDLLTQLKATTQVLEGEMQARQKAGAPVALGSPKVVQADGVGSSATLEAGDGVARQVGQYREGSNPVVDTGSPALARSRNASPISIQVFQLKDNGLFLSADSDALAANPEKVLGKSYVDHDEYVIKPNEFKFVRFYPVKSTTHFIGVVASYHDTDSVTWKDVLRIEPTGGKYPLLVSLDEHGVKIKSED